LGIRLLELRHGKILEIAVYALAIGGIWYNFWNKQHESAQPRSLLREQNPHEGFQLRFLEA